jgi:hypothetical protein
VDGIRNETKIQLGLQERPVMIVAAAGETFPGQAT